MQPLERRLPVGGAVDHEHVLRPGGRDARRGECGLHLARVALLLFDGHGEAHVHLAGEIRREVAGERRQRRHDKSGQRRGHGAPAPRTSMREPSARLSGG